MGWPLTKAEFSTAAVVVASSSSSSCSPPHSASRVRTRAKKAFSMTDSSAHDALSPSPAVGERGAPDASNNIAWDSTRCTDLAAIDMETLLEANLLSYDKQEGVFSGWIHVAEMPANVHCGASSSSSAMAPMRQAERKKARKMRQKLVFHRRYCRLRELICTFYASDDPISDPLDRHVIISVERVHDRNKGFQFLDYEDREILLYTTLGADFEEWYEAFASAVRKTQVSKSRVDGGGQPQEQHRRRHGTTTAGTGAARVGASHLETERSLTDGYLLQKTNSTVSNNSVLDDDDELLLDDRTHTSWLYLQYPWWKLHRRSRRYFVLSGTTLSCFSVNKEGQLADFTTTIVAFAYAPEKDPFAVDVTCASGKTLRLSRTSRARAMEDWVSHLQTPLNYYASCGGAQDEERSHGEPQHSGLV